MLPRKKDRTQLGFYSTFAEQLNRANSLYKLANEIHWEVFEQSFSKHYSKDFGAPAKSIRLMVSLLIIKQLRNLSDESVVEQWSENSYYQYFSGEEYFCSKAPCASTELTEFRKRIGEEGIELIFKESIRINVKDGEGNILSGDTTVQEKNITYPTDDKQYKKIIKKCRTIAEKENIELRQSYTQTIKKLSITQRLKRNKGGEVKARAASRKVKTISGRLIRELERKLTPSSIEKWDIDLSLFKKILSQNKSDNNKIYSLHEPQVKCFSKGKEHKKYEFGSKVSILATQRTGVIVGAINFKENIHDSKTLEQAISQHKRLTNIQAKEVFVDRGYRGLKQIGNTQINYPRPDKTITKTKRNKHKRRAAIEPVIGHLKHDYRMARNYLKGSFGDAVNLMLAASAMNFKRMMNLWKKGCHFFIEFLNSIFQIVFLVKNKNHQKKFLKLTF